MDYSWDHVQINSSTVSTVEWLLFDNRTFTKKHFKKAFCVYWSSFATFTRLFLKYLLPFFKVLWADNPFLVSLSSTTAHVDLSLVAPLLRRITKVTTITKCNFQKRLVKMRSVKPFILWIQEVIMFTLWKFYCKIVTTLYI